jgi:fatty acid-binding protein DegV
VVKYKYVKTRTRDNKNEIERILNSFQNRFGNKVKLIMAYSNRINNSRDNTMKAFLQYEHSESHADAICFFTDENPIIYCGKLLKFIPAGFTNTEKCSQYNDYASQRKRANA